jgi:hypothetical protein
VGAVRLKPRIQQPVVRSSRNFATAFLKSFAGLGVVSAKARPFCVWAVAISLGAEETSAKERAIPHPVLVHSCFQPYAPITLGSGKNKIFHREINHHCSCSRWINFRQRDELLERGEVLIVCHENANGFLVPNWREVVRMFAPSESRYRCSPLLGPPMARCVSKREILRLIEGKEDAEEFVEAYGSLDKQRWLDMLAPFSPDPFEGRCVLGTRGGNCRDAVTRRLTGDTQIRRTWELQLRAFGLDRESLAGNGEKQHLVVPTGATPPVENRVEAELANRFGLPWQSCHQIRVEVHERAVPEWLNNDAQVREFIRHRFPGAFRAVGPNADPASGKGAERRNARRRAVELAALLFWSYRLMWPFSAVAAELKISTEHAERIAADARRHAEKFFAGEKCCRNTRPAEIISVDLLPARAS